jgi:O-antigen ligase
LLGIHHPHNEYIRIFFDFGVVGLGLFLLGSLALFVSLIVVHLRNREGITLAAPLMVAAVALTALTDNPIVFAYVMVPVAVVISVALATDRLRHVSLSAPSQ